MKSLKARLGVMATALALALTACADSDPLNAGLDSGGPGENTVVVGSANFPENVILAEIYSQALEAEGFTVERRFNIGAREVMYTQIESCRITVVPEYNQALLAFLDPDASAKGAEEVAEALESSLPEQLTVLDPSDAQDNNAIVVPQELADEHNLKQIPDLAPIAGELVFVVHRNGNRGPKVM
ncbi:glycine betaine ABC transporter substrate-binding protein [Micrococcoides hystricis]|uniref:Glycine betaine ABC transporter substrate-binding protein n=1 Tax=Micrococcoides hystricis TaxID=1572761 RepID=A0ABV6PB54_9MICC